MKLNDAKDNIGKMVRISGGDVAIHSHLRAFVFNDVPLKIVKVTKSGEVYLQYGKEFVTVSAKYIHLCD